MGNAKRPSSRMRSAKPPWWPTQVASLSAHRFSSPLPHASQARQAPRCHPTPTLWPASRCATSGPAATTVPTISWPGTIG